MVAQTKFPILVSHICAGCVAVLVVGYMLVLGHQMMQGVGPARPMVVALPLGLAALAVLPLWKPLTPKTLRLGAVLLLGAATLVAVWVKFDPPADTIAVYSDTKN
ncbi:MAG: hypothetical protein WAT93_01640 [Pontixanthobacter sp.]